MFKYFLPLFTASLFLLATPAYSQESSPDELREQGIFEVDFPGGSIENYVQLIRDLAPQKHYPHVNIVVPVSTPGGFALPSIKVTTDVDGALECLAACSTDEVSIDRDSSGELGEIDIIRVMDLRPGDESSRAETVQVFNLKHILMKIPRENVVSAIDIGMEISGSEHRAEIKLHEETGLLFAKGPMDQLEIIRQVVNELGDPASINLPLYRPADPGTTNDSGQPEPSQVPVQIQYQQQVPAQIQYDLNAVQQPYSPVPSGIK